MIITSLAHESFDTIFAAFSSAFADYEVQQDKEQLRSLLHRRGFHYELSFGAFDGGKIVAFTCNGTGLFNGTPTAYDTGTGTLKEYRGQGLATQIFEYSLPFLKARGIKQYLLEVLQHNEAAISVYRKLGFEVSREFNYYVQQNNEVRNELKPIDIPYELKPLRATDFKKVSAFQDFHPSWQNSIESVRRASGDFVTWGIFTDRRLIGYAIFDPTSGDVAQLAVDRNFRRKGLASLLLAEMLKTNQYDTVKVLNTDVNCESMTRFLEAKNVTKRGMQFEMVKAL